MEIDLLRIVIVVCVLSCTVQATLGQAPRLRKSWRQHTPSERARFLQALTEAMSSGRHQLFVRMTMDENGLQRVQGTCGEMAWHRKWLLGYENMLRMQDSMFANVTLPYWDFFEDAAMRLSAKTPCSSILACSPWLTDLGGSAGVDLDHAYAVNGVVVQGNCVNQSIASAACSDQAPCEHCLPRGDWDLYRSTLEFGPSALVEVLRDAEKGTSEESLERLQKGMVARFHGLLHTLLGGTYETEAAAFDPVYLGHYAMLDFVYYLQQHRGAMNVSMHVQLCNDIRGDHINHTDSIPVVLDGRRVDEHPSTQQFFQATGTTYEDLRDAAMLGYDYEVDSFLRTLLDAFEVPNLTSANTTNLRYAAMQDDTSVDVRNSTSGVVRAIAACRGNDTTDGKDFEANYTALSCELVAKQQNGVLTSFSPLYRRTINLPASVIPACPSILEKVAHGILKHNVSQACRDALMSEISADVDELNITGNGFVIVTRGINGSVTFVRGNPGR